MADAAGCSNDRQGFAVNSNERSPAGDQYFSTTSVDMEFTSDISSDKHHMASDHPTPSTLSSSNTSYSKCDQQSPQTTQEPSHWGLNGQVAAGSGSLLNNVGQPVHSSSDKNGSPSFTASFFGGGGSGPIPSFDSPGLSLPFSLPTDWNYLVNNQTLNTDGVAATGSDADTNPLASINEAQWAQLFQATEWDGFRS